MFWVLKLSPKVACGWWPLNLFVFSIMKKNGSGGPMACKEFKKGIVIIVFLKF